MSKLTFDIKDNEIKDIFDNNNPFLINISGSVNVCTIRCGQEIDNCNSIKINTMTNYGNILSLNTDANIKCNVKLPYESEGDNKSYVFKTILATVPSLHRINGTIYDMELFTIFTSIQKDGTKLNLVLCTLLSGTDGVPSSGDPKLLNFKLFNELFSGKNTVPEKFGTASINLVPNPIDLSSFIPSNGNRSFYSYTHPKNLNTNIRVFKSTLLVSNNILSILKNKLTPGNTYNNMKNSINTSINPASGLFFYYSEDFTNNYSSFEVNKGFEYKKENNEDKKKPDKKKNNEDKKKSNDKKNNKKKTASSSKSSNQNNKKDSSKSTSKQSSSTSKKEKFSNYNDDESNPQSDEVELDDNIEDFEDESNEDDSNQDEYNEESSNESYDEDEDDDKLYENDNKSKDSKKDNKKDNKKDESKNKLKEKYEDANTTSTETDFVDTDNKNIVSVIINTGFIFATMLFLYIIVSNSINNPSGEPITELYFMDKFNNSTDFKYSALSKLSFIGLYVFCLLLGLIMVIYLLLFFYSPSKFLIQSSSALLVTILIFIIISFIALGSYVYFRCKANASPENIDYSDCDNYTLKMFEWFSIKDILKTLGGNELNSNMAGGADSDNNHPMPGINSNLVMGIKKSGFNSTIEMLNPMWIIIFMLFVPFVIVLSCYLFPNYDNIYSGYVKDFVRTCGANSVIYTIIYIVIFLCSYSFMGVYINKNYDTIKNSNMIMLTLFVITLIVLCSVFLNKVMSYMKAFFIFLLVFLCIFLLFLGYIFYKKIASQSAESGNGNSVSSSASVSSISSKSSSSRTT